MTGLQFNQQPTDPGASRRPAGAPLVRPLGEGPTGGLAKPRVKMIATQGDFTPAGASYTPPAAAPLPERGAGLHLLLSALAAVVALVFLVMFAQKL